MTSNKALPPTPPRCVAPQRLIGGGIAFIWPLHAYAQRIPDLVVILGLMPVLALILSVVLGGLKRSWLVGLGNVGFAALCVVWFIAAALFSKSDLMSWAPIGVLGLHLVGMVILIGLHPFRRRKAGG